MFKGADVDGLDRIAQKIDQAVDFARTVLTVLKMTVRALNAMSWTGWAKAFAIYLETVVIPWVQATMRALQSFSAVIKFASSMQKEVSGDSPRVAVPPSYQTPPLPPCGTENPPMLKQPDVVINVNVNGGGTGVQVTTPQLPGTIGVLPDQGGSTGVGGFRTMPDVVRIDPGTNAATGAGGTTTPGTGPGVSAPGQNGAIGGGVQGTGVTAQVSGSAGGTGASGAGSSVSTPPYVPGNGGLGGGATGDSAAGAGAGGGPGVGGGGGGGGGVSGGANAGGGGMIGSLGGSASSGGLTGNVEVSRNADGTWSFEAGASGTVGTPNVTSTPINTGGGSLDGGSATGDGGVLPSVEDAGGANGAMLAAPLGLAGLAGLGAAALGNARGQGGAPDGDEDEQRSGPSASAPGGYAGLIGGGPDTGGLGTPGGLDTDGGGAGWEVGASIGDDGHRIDLAEGGALGAALDPAATPGTGVGGALSAGTDTGRHSAWTDLGGDRPTGENITYDTPYGQVVVDRIRIAGDLGGSPAPSAVVLDWWEQALTGAPGTEPATDLRPGPFLTCSLPEFHAQSVAAIGTTSAVWPKAA